MNMWDIYVYYRCPEYNISRDKELGRLLIHTLTAGSEIQAGLFCKKDQSQTLMEVYRGVSDDVAFCQHMANEVSALYQKHMATIPDRHIEIFSAV